MKPEELLDSLDQVGEDLLAAAEQTILARKRRPWAGAAAAAVLLIALGAGGFFLLRNLRSREAPASTATPGGPGGVTASTVEPPPPGTVPDRLTVGDCWTGRSRAVYDDLERSMDGDLVAQYDADRLMLPVYEREGGALKDPDHLYQADQLRDRLNRAAAWIGVTLPDEVSSRTEEVEGVTRVEAFSAETDQGTLTVCADGRISMLYNEKYSISSSVKAELSGELTLAETQRVLRDLRMEDCGAKLAERLGLGECRFVTCDHWDPASSAWTVFTVYPVREDPAEQLVSRYFESVRLLTNDGWTLRGFELDRFPAEEGAEAPEGLRLVGKYGLRTAAQAKTDVLSGNYLCEEPLDPDILPVLLQAGNLVYLTDAGHDRLMPFYCFWVPSTTVLDGSAYVALYVPALENAFLTDFPSNGTEEAGATETGPEATVPEPTEPPDGYQPMPAGRDAEGTPRIAGPAGTVKALLYMGSELHDPVWADLDGDGFRELVYWCDGPTSGLFTAGLCVYGLEAGWPVLKAAQIYTLTWGELRLAEEGGRVLLHYTPQGFDPAAGSTVSQAEQILSVSVQDGELLLNGGVLPEGCELWDGPEWSWYGRSFTEMNAIAREAAAQSGIPRLPLNASACLVWPQVTGSSVPTAGQRVFAAVTENGVTVTGLLRWEPLQDGTYFCAMQGIEAIEAPKPAELLGLSAEALTERLGPRHFETDDPTPKLCWFTKDCRLLTVTMDGVAAEAGLQGLVELAEQTRGQAYTLKEGAVCFRQPGGERAVYSAERDGRYCLFFNWEDPETGMIYLNGFGGIEISVESWDALEAYPDALPPPDAPVP